MLKYKALTILFLYFSILTAHTTIDNVLCFDSANDYVIDWKRIQFASELTGPANRFTSHSSNSKSGTLVNTGLTVKLIDFPPTIASFSPVSGPAGSIVTITGTGFNTTAAENIVYFGGARATVIAATATTLTVTVPTGATYMPVSVLNTSNSLSGYSKDRFITTFSNNCSASFGPSSFAPKVDFTTGNLPLHVALADLDGDEKLDMITLNQGTGGSVSVFRNTAVAGTVASSSFATNANFSTIGNFPTGIATGDIDNDGKIDLVVSMSFFIAIYRNTSTTGSISFASNVNYAVGTSSSGIDLGDIDGDGKLDIAMANESNNFVSILRNTSTPNIIDINSFAPKVDFTTNTGPTDVVLGDIDGDGKIDIAAANRIAGNVSILRNLTVPGSITSASFSAKVDFTVNSGPQQLTMGDIDGDGKLDIAVCNSNSSNISVLRNTSTSGSITTASFSPKTDLTVNAFPTSFALADMNGDGRIDMIVSDSAYGYVSVFLNTSVPGNITYASSVSFTGNEGPAGSVIGDVDGDGKPDMVISTGSRNNQASVLRNAIAPVTVASPSAGNVTSSTVCDNGTWKTLYNSSGSETILAIKDNGNNLGAITATTYVDAGPVLGNGKYFMSRHFVITVANQPSGPVQVRLYFTDAELAALQAADPSIQSVSDIGVIKFSGANEDGSYNLAEGTSVLIPNTSITTGREFGANYIEFTVTGFSEFWLQSAASTLPVDLTSFTASPQASGIQLNWSTASESNSDRFEVEKSTDGISFTTAATVKAAGSADTRRSYTAIDAHPAEGLNYYRLKQVDKDGKSEYYQVISIKWENASKTLVTLAPQPMINSMTVKIKASVTNGSFQIYTLTGREVRNYPVNAGSGATTVQVNRGSLSSGVYIYRLSSQNGGLLESGKIILE